LREQVAKVLGIPTTRRLDADAPLVGLGLDSLLAVELRNALSRGLALPRRLPATLLFDYPTIATLTDHLLGMMVEAAPTPARLEPVVLIAAAASTASTNGALERDIMDLTDEEAEALLLEELE
jgi:aryl carrier-like protein